MQRIARITAATFLLVGAGIHLDLWRGGYRGIRYIGPLFVANVAVSTVVVLALLLSADARVAAAGVLLSLGSITALVLSRTTGLLGFTERAWTHMALQATTAELGAVVAIALALMASRPTMVPALAAAEGRRSR